MVIHSPELEVLLLERAAHPGYWQSVTGSQEEGESLQETAQREVAEETGIIAPPDAFRDGNEQTDSRFLPSGVTAMRRA